MHHPEPGPPHGATQSEAEHCSSLLEENIALRRHSAVLMEELDRERRRLAELQNQILVNPHTGVPGLQAFKSYLSTMIENDQSHHKIHSPSKDHRFFLVVVKLDSQYDLVVKTLKESASEWILYQTAMRLGESLAPEEKVFHTADDEFILLWYASSTRELLKRLTMLHQVLDRHHGLAGVRLHIGTHFGIAHYPHHGRNHQSLRHAANLALTLAIKTDKPWVLYQEQFRQDVVDKMELQNGILKALESQAMHRNTSQFHLAYQPQVGLRTDHQGNMRICEINAEVLLRWNHPSRGLISPAQFIPLAEETGLIQPLGTWLIHRASAQLQAWKGTALEKAVISINVSPKQFINDQLVHSIDRLTRKEPAIAKRIKLEVTESSLLENTETCLKYMHYLRSLGIQFAVDDFGKDYSSLSYLRKLPVNTIKIDKSFIDNINTSHHDQVIVRAISRLAKDLNLKVVVEGVETSSQLAFLVKEGCSTIQGYFFSKPISAEQFSGFYRKAMDKRVSIAT